MILLSACAIDYKKIRINEDTYPDLKTLQANHIYGRDYSIEFYDRGSDVVVLAIHGGQIEDGTSQVARQIASTDFNLYLFEGWLGRNSKKLHISSPKFDDPYAISLTTSSILAISIHGQADRGEVVCIGGTNEAVKQKIAENLIRAGFKVETPCKRLPGESPHNIVNKARKGGVQLEITSHLLKRLKEDNEYLSKFANEVRSAINETIANSREK
ncbi:MAG: poly-gamma-glutamate hydrolase family protein [Elusimicrobiales bacterium]